METKKNIDFLHHVQLFSLALLSFHIMFLSIIDELLYIMHHVVGPNLSQYIQDDDDVVYV